MAKRWPRLHEKRRGPSRKGLDRVPILCEGEQTEVSYFRELLAYYL